MYINVMQRVPCSVKCEQPVVILSARFKYLNVCEYRYRVHGTLTIVAVVYCMVYDVFGINIIPVIFIRIGHWRERI